MKQIKHLIFRSFTVLACCLALLILQQKSAIAQASTVTTTGTFLNNNGSGCVTFNFQNTNGYDVIITGIDGVTGTSGSQAVEFWYKTTPLAGAPGAISVANGWTQVAASTIIGIANTTTTVTQNFFSGLSFIMPAGQTYAFAVFATGQRYYTIVPPYLPTVTLSAGGCNIITGDNIGYGGGTPPAAPTNTPRGWIGSITFNPNGPCINPPTPGTVTSTANPACPNTNFTLSLTGGTGGMGQTFQWEISPNNVSWSPIGGATNATLTTMQMSSNYYRCAVTCGVSVTSLPLQVITNGTPLSGTYTINSALPTGGTNFQTFNALALALNCGGLSGPTTVNVVSGSGPYSEQVEFLQIGGSSAVNTLTINGNGETITYGATLAAAPHTMALNGTDFVKINNLVFVGTGATYAFPCHLWNNANNNKFTNCTFTCPANCINGTQVPFSISGSASVATTAGPSGSNDTVQGCTMNSGYYCTTLVGNSAAVNTGNVMTGCNVKDYYFYGSYNLYNNGAVISYNTFERPTRTTLSTYYGVYIGTGCVGYLVNGNRLRHPFGAAPTNTGTSYVIYCAVDGTLGNENRIINNLISDFNSGGIIYAMYLTTADYIKVYHNTISLDQGSSTATGATYGIYNTGTVGGVDIKNNIVSITRGGSGIKYGLYYSGAFVASNNNDIYLNAPAGTNYVGYYLAGYLTLANWQTANGGVWDQQSVSLNPAYTSPPTNDYTPSNLTINNLGTGVGVTTDIILFPRLAGTPDMGAYEFANASIDMGVTALVAPDNTGCYAAAQNVTITIQNFGITNIDFSLTPATVNCNVSGALVASLTNTINTGSLAPNTSMNFTFTTPINMTVNGTYNFSTWTVLAGDGNAANDYLTPAPSRTVGLVAGTITSSIPNACVTGSPVLTLAGSAGGAIQWKSSTISPGGPWTNVGGGLTTYAPGAVTQTTYYQADLTCNANTVSTATYTFTVNNPAVLTTTADTVCSGNSAILEATGNVGNTINWFATPTGGTSLYTGSPFATPALPATTTYYAEASAGGGGGNVAAPMPPQLSNYVGNVRGYSFTAPTSFTLTGLQVLGTAIGAQSIAIVKFTPAAQPPAYPTVTNAFTVLYITQNNPATGVIPVNIPINTGDVIGVLGQIGSNNTSYANPAGPYVTTIDGQSVTLTRMGMQYLLSTTSPIDLWTEATGSIGRVELTYSVGCAGTRVPVVATVNPSPVVTATPAVASVCQGSSLTLTGGGAGAGGTYAWTGGVADGVAFPATASTIYTVTGTSAGGCSNTATANITVNPIMTGTASVSPTPICLGGSSTFTGSIPTICAGTVNNFAGIYAPATWTISTTNSNGVVNIGGAPASILMTSGNNLSGIAGTTNFTKTIGCNGTVSFNWTYASADAFGSIFDYPRYTINGGAPVTFTAFVVGGANNQTGAQTIAVNAGDVLQLQAYTIDNDPTSCDITISNFSAPAAPVGGTVSFWDAAIGGTNLGAPPLNVTPAAAGNLTYYAEYTALGTGCINPTRDPVTLVVNGLPTVGGSASPSAICSGENSVLTGSGAASYGWNPGALTGAPTVTPAATTTYTVVGTDINGCTSDAQVTVTVNPVPTVIANPASQTLCENAVATIFGSGTATSYSWTGGITDNTPFVVTASNTYTVTGTDGNGCSNTATADVIMNAAPLVSAAATPNTTCNNTSVTPTGTGPNLVWSGGLTNGVPFIATATTTYTVTGTDGIGCSASSTVTVTVNPSAGILAPASSNQNQDMGDGFDVSYYDGSCNLIADVVDDPGGNTLGFTIAAVTVDAVAGSHNGQPFVRRWYQITPTSNGPADVVIYVNQSDFDDYNAVVTPPYLPLPTSGNNADPNIPNIRITKNDNTGPGNNPLAIVPNTVYWNGTYWEFGFTTPSFSQFRVHGANPGNVPLPVTVLNFNGKKLDNSDELSWTTGSEQNNAYFNLQHSTDGISFSTIAKINTKALNGNSTASLNYNAINSKPELGHNYYRLQQVDIDNKASVHAKIVDLIWGANGSTVNIYPNPTKDVLNIDLYTTKVQNTTVKVLDMSGRIIKQIQAKSAVGMNNIKISMGEIASGLYTVQVYENEQLTHTGKVRKSE